MFCVESCDQRPILAFAATTELWGLSLNETLAIVAVILIVLDFFFITDILTHLAYVIVSVVCARAIRGDFHFLYRVLFGIVAWFAVVAVHYAVWKSHIQPYVHRVIAPERYKAGPDGLVGLIGEVKEVEGAQLVELKGDLWQFRSSHEVRCCDRVEVNSVENGVLVVALVKSGGVES